MIEVKEDATSKAFFEPETKAFLSQVLSTY
jgi:hypothetical protein